jgi:hypothetical protein
MEQISCVLPPPPYDGHGGDGSGSNGNCFAPGTPVTLADGSSKAIDRIEIGDEVMSFNEATGKLEPHRVTHLFVHPHPDSSDPVLLVNGHLKVTANHSFYVEGKWVHAGKLQLGDRLTTTTGAAAVDVASVGTFTATVPVVYNIEVEEAHTYFADGILVHNMMKTSDQPDWTTVQPTVGQAVTVDGSGGSSSNPCQDYCLSTLDPSCSTVFTPDCDSAMNACLAATAINGCAAPTRVNDPAATTFVDPATGIVIDLTAGNAVAPVDTTDAGAL